MPTIESCRSCHAGEHTLAKVRSPCISCHTFHGANPSAAALKGREMEQQDVGPGRIAALSASARPQ
jgi:hypothetical protein